MAKLDDILNPQPPRPILTQDYAPSSVHCEFVTGPAGSGKTYNQKAAIEEDPGYGTLCATTGIAAINLNAQTLNSVLGFFDTDSLAERLSRGYLTSAVASIAKSTRRLVIDEVSMMDGMQLDYIYKAALDANNFKYLRDRPFGITLTGDFCQLPPVKAKWAFEADCWEHFERNTTTLTTNYRQANGPFLEALSYARAGDGNKAASILADIGVKFVPAKIPDYDGTTIISKNDLVDNFNYASLLKLPGAPFSVFSSQWGSPAGEWKKIPGDLKLKDGAYVMILANSPRDSEFRYVNGDTGHVVSKDANGIIWVKLVRSGETVPIGRIIRHNAKRSPKEMEGADPFDDAHTFEHIFCKKDECGYDEAKDAGAWGQITYNCTYGTWNMGAIKYYPLRLAYATTVHKSQGLTLDRCQIECRDKFFGTPAMAYVALSRCKTPEGLTIVGTPANLAERIKTDPKVKRFL